MGITVTSPITGAPMSGLTSPTFTMSVDQAPTPYGKQWAATALGGTQTGVLAHSIFLPFTVNFVRPVAYKAIVNPGAVVVERAAQKNQWKIITRKGVFISGTNISNAFVGIAISDESVSIPVGGETNDPLSVKSFLSMKFGLMWTNGTQFADAITTGIF